MPESRGALFCTRRQDSGESDDRRLSSWKVLLRRGGNECRPVVNEYDARQCLRLD